MRRTLPVLVSLAACGGDVRLVDRRTVESFTVNDTLKPADVLFVVDDSGSMAEEQARIASDVSAMVDVLAGALTDVHVGVVTTSVDDAGGGELIGGLMTDVDAIVAGLATALLAGTDGARSEQGLLAAKLALDGRTEGFPRVDATLDVIVLSDEDDHSPKEPSDYLDAWTQLAPLGVRVHGVVGDQPEGCFSEDGAASAGDRYIELIEATGGYRESICAPAYREILERLGLDLVGTADTWVLGYVPVVDTIEVEVDREVVPEDPVEGWTYEPAPNAVVFHGDSVPVAGQSVVVRYQKLAGVAPPGAGGSGD